MGFKFVGADKLEKALRDKAKLAAAKQIVRSCGTKLQRGAENNAPVDTGTLKRSITIEIEDDGLTAVVAPHTEYAAYVEYGTRYMTAQPYMRPAYEEVKAEFKSKMEELVR